jgi:hypothetical protein
MDIETIRKEYFSRNNLDTLREEDKLLINAIYNLRKNYAQELEKRKTTILIDHKEAFVAPIVQKETEKKKQAIKITNPSVDVQYCQAIKMDGNKCTAKAKYGGCFCGRHNKS